MATVVLHPVDDDALVAGMAAADPEAAAAFVRRFRSRVYGLARSMLAAIGGRTALEVSDAEGIPLGTAKTRIRTALQRLRVSLATEGLA